MERHHLIGDEAVAIELIFAFGFRPCFAVVLILVLLRRIFRVRIGTRTRSTYM